MTRDAEAVTDFVERFASVMFDAGVPRMPARVLAALLVTDSGRLTAAELAEVLNVSPAAISGAVRYLIQTHLIMRERQRGSRRDAYRLEDDLWYEAMVDRQPLLVRWERALAEGADVVGPDTPAGRRLARSAAFYGFMQKEVPAMLARWRKFAGNPRKR